MIATELPITEAYTVCEQGHSHWGTAGAAGLFLKSSLPDGTVVVLLQHRSPEVHEGDCWGVPGGAREWNEPVLAGAVREAAEELEMALPPIRLEREVVVDHGGWSYTTVIGLCDEAFELPTEFGWETGDEGFAWVPLADLPSLNLHSGMRHVLEDLIS